MKMLLVKDLEFEMQDGRGRRRLKRAWKKQGKHELKKNRLVKEDVFD